MRKSDEGKTYWESVACAYAALGPPLRPSSADIAHMKSAVEGWSASRGRSPQVLLLGVTPQIAKMRWPPGSALLAADNAVAMVRTVWPGNVPGRRAVVCANWPSLPLRESSRDLVVGDGSFSCVRYPNGFRAMAAEVRRILRQDGLLILRSYIQTVPPERKEDVMDDLLHGAIPSFHWFKFRLLMAMQLSSGQGVPVEDVYRYWVNRNIDETALIAKTGWDAAGIRMMELYRGTDTIHTFSTLAELQTILLEFFEEVAVSTTSDIMGHRCPILLAWPRGNQRCVHRASGVAECAV